MFTIPNWARGHFPRLFWSLHEYLHSLWKWQFSCSFNGHVGTPPSKVCWLLSLKWLAYFWIHNLGCFSNICLYGIHSWSHKTTYHSSMGIRLREVTRLYASTLWWHGLPCHRFPSPKRVDQIIVFQSSYFVSSS